MLSEYSLRINSEESVAEKRGRDEFRRLARERLGLELRDFCEGDELFIEFADNPANFKENDGGVSVLDGILTFEGSGCDSIRLAVDFYFDEYGAREDMTPSEFTVDDYAMRRKIDVLEYLNRETVDISDGCYLSPEKKADGPVCLYWQNNTVYPDETVNMIGVNFEADSTVEISRISDQSGDDALLEDKREVKPTIVTDTNIMFIIPADMKMGVFRVRVKNSRGYSNEIDVNSPNAWWFMGDEGENASEGGTLQIMGNAMSFDTSRVMLLSDKGTAHILSPYFYDGYCVKVRLPRKIKKGNYKIYVNNGYGGNAVWTYHDKVEVIPPRPAFGTVIEMSPKDTDMKAEIQSALNTLGKSGGGTLILANGEYTVLGMLKIPQNVTLKCKEKGGARIHMHEMVDMRENSVMDNLSLVFFKSESGYLVQINGDGVRMYNTLIMPALDYLPNHNGRATTELAVSAEGVKNLVVDGCEIYAHFLGVVYAMCEYSVFRNCTVKSPDSSIFTRACHRTIVENNFLTTIHVQGSASIAVQLSGLGSYMNYVAYNTLLHTLHNDREAFTYDDHGMYYYGKMKVDGTNMTCLSNPQITDSPYRWMYTKGNVRAYKAFSIKKDREWYGGICVIIVKGRGLGQCRNVIDVSSLALTIDREWDIMPDENSVFSVGAFNGRHIITDNNMTEAGVCVQPYPPNWYSIVARNISKNAGGFTAASNLLIKDINGRELTLCEVNFMTDIVDNTVLSNVRGISYQGHSAVSVSASVNIDDNVRPTMGITVKRNRLYSNTRLSNTGATFGVIMEKNDILNSYTGIELGRGKFVERPTIYFPENYVIRKNRLMNIRIPMFMYKLENDKVGERI